MMLLNRLVCFFSRCDNHFGLSPSAVNHWLSLVLMVSPIILNTTPPSGATRKATGGDFMLTPTTNIRLVAIIAMIRLNRCNIVTS